MAEGGFAEGSCAYALERSRVGAWGAAARSFALLTPTRRLRLCGATRTPTRQVLPRRSQRPRYPCTNLSQA